MHQGRWLRFWLHHWTCISVNWNLIHINYIHHPAKQWANHMHHWRCGYMCVCVCVCVEEERRVWSGQLTLMVCLYACVCFNFSKKASNYAIGTISFNMVISNMFCDSKQRQEQWKDEYTYLLATSPQEFRFLNLLICGKNIDYTKQRFGKMSSWAVLRNIQCHTCNCRWRSLSCVISQSINSITAMAVTIRTGLRAASCMKLPGGKRTFLL